MKLQNESGRSMIEMTAVLAIIGVLSIGSVAGYKLAMVQMRSNTLLNEAARRAVSISSQLNQGNVPNLDEFKNNTIAGDMVFDTAINTDSYIGKFGLKVSNVPYKICNKLLEAKNQAGSSLRAIADPATPYVALEECPKGQGANADDEVHDYILIYNNDLATTQPYEQDCSQALDILETCTDGVYEKCCKDNGNICHPQVRCAKDYEDGCPGDQTDQGGVCKCPKDNYFANASGTCYSCDYLNRLTGVQGQECRYCSNRTYTQQDSVNDTGWCELTTCPTGYYKNSSGNCVDCLATSTSAVTATQENCQKCAADGSDEDGNSYARSYVATNKCYRCPDTSPLLNSTTCRACTYSDSLATDAVSCARCSNSVYINSKCVRCDTNNVLSLTQAQCGQCSQRTYDTNLSGSSKCKLTNCPTSTAHFRGKVGTCYACSNATAVEVASANDCTGSCSTRSTYTSGSGTSARTYCYLNTCDDNHFVDSSKNCRKCDNASAYAVANTAACTGPCTGGKVNNVQTTKRVIQSVTSANGTTTNYCKLNACPNASYFRNYLGSCVSCTSTTAIGNAGIEVDVSNNDCTTKCTQREVKQHTNNKYYCVKK